MSFKTSLLNIILVIKSRTMKWAGHVARMGEVRNVWNILVDHSEDIEVDGKITLEWMLGKYCWKMWTG
jgi:hypothetical protein